MTTWQMSSREVKEDLLSKPGAYCEAVFIDGRFAGVWVMLPNPGYEEMFHEYLTEEMKRNLGLPPTCIIESKRISTLELWAFHNSLTKGPAAN